MVLWMWQRGAEVFEGVKSFDKNIHKIYIQNRVLFSSCYMSGSLLIGFSQKDLATFSSVNIEARNKIINVNEVIVNIHMYNVYIS